MIAGKSWSEDEDRLLAKLILQGRRAREIAKIFSRTTGSIRGRAGLLNISWRQRNLVIRRRKELTASRSTSASNRSKRPVWTLEEDAALGALSAKGAEAVAKELGRSVTAVQVRASLKRISLRCESDDGSPEFSN